MITQLINVIIQFLALSMGICVSICLILMMVRLTQASWKFIPQALIGDNGTMEPIELASVVTGQISIFIIVIGPFLNYKYDNEIFFTVFAAFCVATGVYAYKSIKNGNGKNSAGVPKK